MWPNYLRKENLLSVWTRCTGVAEAAVPWSGRQGWRWCHWCCCCWGWAVERADIPSRRRDSSRSRFHWQLGRRCQRGNTQCPCHSRLLTYSRAMCGGALGRAVLILLSTFEERGLKWYKRAGSRVRIIVFCQKKCWWFEHLKCQAKMRPVRWCPKTYFENQRNL